MELDIDKDSLIDPDALDVEWVEHPHKFDKYSTHLDDVTAERNDKKLEVEKQEEEVKRVKADLDLRIRKDPDEFDLEKVTENSIAAVLLTSPEYQEAMNKLFRLKEELNEKQDAVNRAYTSVNTMIAKRTALQELDGLLRMSYFSAPMESRNLSEEYHKRTEINKTRAKEKIRKRRRM